MVEFNSATLKSIVALTTSRLSQHAIVESVQVRKVRSDGESYNEGVILFNFSTKNGGLELWDINKFGRLLREILGDNIVVRAGVEKGKLALLVYLA